MLDDPQAAARLAPLLARGRRALRLDLPDPVPAKLVGLVRILARWGRAYNLTSVREPEEMVPHHLLDSLSILPYVDGPRILDIGAGAGLPGIPLALARPDLRFVLLDGNAKKVRFMIQAVHELGLTNAEVVHARVEDYAPAERFPVLVARAFAAIPDMLARCRHLAAPGARLLAMKGVYPREELAALGDRYAAPRVEPLKVPGVDAARHLVIITLD